MGDVHMYKKQPCWQASARVWLDEFIRKDNTEIIFLDIDLMMIGGLEIPSPFGPLLVEGMGECRIKGVGYRGMAIPSSCGLLKCITKPLRFRFLSRH